jgi:hypothetical protein
VITRSRAAIVRPVALRAIVVLVLVMAAADIVGGVGYALDGSPLPKLSGTRLAGGGPLIASAARRQPPPTICGTAAGTVCLPVYSVPRTFRYTWNPDCGDPLNLNDQMRCLKAEHAAWAASRHPRV